MGDVLCIMGDVPMTNDTLRAPFVLLSLQTIPIVLAIISRSCFPRLEHS